MGSLIDEVRQREAIVAQERKPIDYVRMARVWPKQKAALTRARKSGDPEKVAAVCKAAVAEWDAIGAWPDGWSLFQRTLDDALGYGRSVRLESL